MNGQNDENRHCENRKGPRSETKEASDGNEDCRCSPEETESMIPSASSVPFDQSIATEFTVSDLSEKTVSAYRNHYRVLWPDSGWNSLDNEQFLMAIGAAALDKGVLRPTFAGLLMFGASHDICAEMPGYMLDYREYDDGPLEWTDRFTSVDGDWSGNLFEFFLESLRHLRRTFRHRMRIGPDLKRIDDSEMDKIVREALLNAVVNTDFSGSGGLVVERRPGIASIRNPGTLMMPLERMLAGGTSDPRNPTVFRMLQFIGFGKGIGSGVPDMNALCAADGIPEPAFIEHKGPDIVTVRISVPANVDEMSPYR